MSDVDLELYAERFYGDEVLCRGLHSIGCTTARDILKVPFIKLMSNKDIMSRWDYMARTMLNYCGKFGKEERRAR